MLYAFVKNIILSILLTVPGARAAKESKIRAFYTHVECPYYNPQFIEEFSCWLVPAKDSTLMLNAKLRLAHELNNVTVRFKFSIERNGKYDTYLQSELDICMSLGHLYQNMLLKMILAEVRRTANFPLQCPLKKKFAYLLENYTIDSNALPPYIPELNWGSFAEFYSEGIKGMTINTFGKVAWVGKKNRKY